MQTGPWQAEGFSSPGAEIFTTTKQTIWVAKFLSTHTWGTHRNGTKSLKKLTSHETTCAHIHGKSRIFLLHFKHIGSTFVFCFTIICGYKTRKGNHTAESMLSFSFFYWIPVFALYMDSLHSLIQATCTIGLNHFELQFWFIFNMLGQVCSHQMTWMSTGGDNGGISFIFFFFLTNSVNQGK